MIKDNYAFTNCWFFSNTIKIFLKFFCIVIFLGFDVFILVTAKTNLQPLKVLCVKTGFEDFPYFQLCFAQLRFCVNVFTKLLLHFFEKFNTKRILILKPHSAAYKIYQESQNLVISRRFVQQLFFKKLDRFKVPEFFTSREE